MKIAEIKIVGWSVTTGHWSPALSGSETSASRSKRGRALRVGEVNLGIKHFTPRNITD